MYKKRTRSISITLILTLLLSLVPSTAGFAAEAPAPPNITLDQYNEIALDMSKEDVMGILGDLREPESLGTTLTYKGAIKDSNAVKKVEVLFDESGLVYKKELSFAFKPFSYVDGVFIGGGYGYTGKAKKLTVPAYMSEKVSRDSGKQKTKPVNGIAVLKKGLTALDVSKCQELIFLGCDKNKLTKLDVSKCKKLEILDCCKNKIKKLNLKKNKKLQYLIFPNNEIKKLNLTKNKKLIKLDCTNNKIGKLNLTKNKKLDILYADNNRIKKLNVTKCKRLNDLYCANNKLKKINVTKNKKLYDLDCSNNKLKTINLKKNKELIALFCYKNQMKSLNVSKNKKMTLLHVDKKLKCFQLPKALRKVKPYKYKGGWVYNNGWSYGY